MVKLFVLEGSISAGKSSLIQRLKVSYKFKPSILFIDEPVHLFETWKEFAPLSILEQNPVESGMIQLHLIRSLFHYYANLDPSISGTTCMTQGDVESRYPQTQEGDNVVKHANACADMMSWLIFAIASVFIGSGRSQNVTMTYMFRRENVS